MARSQGSQANYLSRLGAGLLATSQLFSRQGEGLVVNQLITDLGRTGSLVANARLQAQAAAQTTQATRFDIILGVNRAYFGVLESQALVRVAQETVYSPADSHRSGDRARQCATQVSGGCQFRASESFRGATAADPRAGQPAAIVRGSGSCARPGCCSGAISTGGRGPPGSPSADGRRSGSAKPSMPKSPGTFRICVFVIRRHRSLKKQRGISSAPT